MRFCSEDFQAAVEAEEQKIRSIRKELGGITSGLAGTARRLRELDRQRDFKSPDRQSLVSTRAAQRTALADALAVLERAEAARKHWLSKC